MPGKSAADRAVKDAVELTDAVSNFKHASPLKDTPSTQLVALAKLAENFKVAASPGNQKLIIAQNEDTMVPHEVEKTKPLVLSPRVKIISPPPPPSPGVKFISPPPTPSPRVQTPMDIAKEVHIIPDSEYHAKTVHR